MATTTTRLVLRKPDPTPGTGDLVSATLDLNQNWDKVDAAVGAVACTSGVRPATPFNGQFARETDTGNLILCTNTVGPVWTRVLIDLQSRWPGLIDAGRAGATDVLYAGRLNADSQDRVRIRADGRLMMGSGAVAPTAQMYYEGTAGIFRIDDGLKIGTVRVGAGRVGQAAAPNVTTGITTTETLFGTGSITFNAVSGNRYNMKWTGTYQSTVGGDAVSVRMRYATGASVGAGGTLFRSFAVHCSPTGASTLPISIHGDFVAPTTAQYTVGILAIRTAGSGSIQFIGGEGLLTLDNEGV